MRSVLRLLRDRLPGPLGRDPRSLAERRDVAGLVRESRGRDPDRAARAVAPLGRIEPRAVAEVIPDLMRRPEAVLRRAALRALADAAVREPERIAPLLPAVRRVLEDDRRREVQLAAASVLLACGDPGALDWARGLGDERLRTFFGEEETAPLMEFDPPGAALRLAQMLRPGEGLARWRERTEAWLEGGGELRPMEAREADEARERLRAQARLPDQSREAWEATVNLAALGDPADYDLLLARYRSAPGPGLVQAVKGFGLLGDPRAVGLLGARIIDHDADPELGFALRRHGATALGRIGSPRGLSHLIPAMRIEEDHWEGRPGAGCGVVFPVRANLLWALGEIGDPSAAEEVALHLADESGPASGGFYLYAMDALLKMGPGAIPGIERALAHGPPRTSEDRRARERMRANAEEVLRRLRARGR